MAGENRASSPPVEETPASTPSSDTAAFAALAAEPYAHDFFQALRRIEGIHPEKPRMGESVRAADDPVRLTHNPSLLFPPAAVARFEPAGAKWRLVQNILGLLGPNGALPLHLTEYAESRRLHHRDNTFVRFLDVFHHRMLALFYRAWAASQPTVSFDRPESDRFAFYLGSLFGIGPEPFRDRDAMPDLAKLFFAGRFVAQARNAEGLEAVLRAFFRVPVRIKEFVGEWMALPAESHFHLGESPDIGVLGQSATIGGRVWGAHQKFRLVLGPMSFDDYQRLLPGGESLQRMIAIVRNYVGDALTWDVNMILSKENVRPCQLGAGTRLGWDSWMIDGAADSDRHDLTLKPMAYANRPAAAGAMATS